MILCELRCRFRCLKFEKAFIIVLENERDVTSQELIKPKHRARAKVYIHLHSASLLVARTADIKISKEGHLNNSRHPGFLEVTHVLIYSSSSQQRK